MARTRAPSESIHDGDTFRVLVQDRASEAKGKRLPDGLVDVGWTIEAHPGATIAVHVDVRLYGCNAAELATDQGKTALAYLEQLMPVGTPVHVLSYGPDKYGSRWDCAISLPDGRDLTAVMVAAGQAAPWNGEGPKPVPATARRAT